MNFLTNFHYFRQPTDHPHDCQNGHNINNHFDIKLLSKEHLEQQGNYYDVMF